MTRTASYLEELGYTLRSGGAVGADTAFERGVKDPKNKEIYYAKDATPEAETIASKIHPNWGACSPLVRKLHARNILQCLGRDLSLASEFLVCWTPNGYAIGGTRTAIVAAAEHQIPVFNLGNPSSLAHLDEFLFTLKTGIR